MWVDRLETTIESHTLPVAHVREACSIPGTSGRTAWLCRDKPSMKQVLRGRRRADRGLHGGLDGARGGVRLRRRRGLPGRSSSRAPAPARSTPCASTTGPSSTPALVDVRRRSTPSRSRSSSRATRASTTRCRSTACRAWTSSRTTTRTCSRRCGTAGSRRSSSSTNRVDAVRTTTSCGRWGSGSTRRSASAPRATHMEWFFGPKGLRFSEIGCRPPGVGAWDLYSAGNDIDLYREWAHAVVHGSVEQRAVAAAAPPASSRCGPTATARSSGYEGVDDVQARLRRVGDRRPPARPRAPRRSRWRPATWPTPGCGCGTPTTTSCAGCSTTSGAASACTPGERPSQVDGARPAAAAGPRPGGPVARALRPVRHGHRRLAGARAGRRRARRAARRAERQPGAVRPLARRRRARPGVRRRRARAPRGARRAAGAVRACSWRRRCRP